MSASLHRLSAGINILLITLITLLILSGSVQQYTSPEQRLRRYVREVEFDYVSWTLDALGNKNAEAALDVTAFLPASSQRAVLAGYLKDVRARRSLEAEIDAIYGDPSVSAPQQVAATKISERDRLRRQIVGNAPLAEAIVQQQITSAVAEAGLTLGGQPIPPVLYQVSSLPYALIVSPRDKITQIANISLLPELTLEQAVAIEKNIEADQDVSALVVEIGGVGVYPTMVMETTNLTWLTDTVAHEWIHNYLTLRPLGLLYDYTPELRTMNETTASIAGAELGALVMQQHYADLLPPPAPTPKAAQEQQQPPPPDQPPEFNFRKEMHETRVTVDRMLADGQIEQAEAYMEQRRVFMWENGYQIRRLNQAYFAFHGAYADSPQGAAGEDPVGPAVRELRARSDSLAEFIDRMAWMTSFEQLQRALMEIQSGR